MNYKIIGVLVIGVLFLGWLSRLESKQKKYEGPKEKAFNKKIRIVSYSFFIVYGVVIFYFRGAVGAVIGMLWVLLIPIFCLVAGQKRDQIHKDENPL